MRGGLRNGGGAKGDKVKDSGEWAIASENGRFTMPD